jgi:hypothetical protein
MQVKFLESDNAIMKQQIKDLQETLKINKDLIANLIGCDPSDRDIMENYLIKNMKV